MHNQKLYAHALNITGAVGPKGFAKLKKFFADDLRAAWLATPNELISAGFQSENANVIGGSRLRINPENEYEKLLKTIGEPIAEHDAGYPGLLRETPYAPYLLYCRGKLDFKEALAIVGTRRPTGYGAEVCKKISATVAQSGIAVISGLALGIDGIAHETVLQTGGKTVAVLGTGVDDESIYPRLHKNLAHKIIQSGGAVISEFPPGIRGFKSNFPQRNRIIAGISRGTLVIEARKKSGALITARYALDYNRDVFAVPGSIFSAAAEGPHKLIQDGAMLVTSGDEIIEHYGLSIKKTDAVGWQNLNQSEAKIITALASAMQLDELAHATGIHTQVLNSTLSMLELKNLVKNIGNRTYIRV